MTRTVKDADKAWKIRQTTNKRQLGNREIRNLFHIYCEGENTEPEYFKSFPVNTETKIEAIGLGMSKTALVEEAIRRFSNAKFLKKQTNYDPDRQLWVVFDFDVRGVACDSADFNNAIEFAQKKGIRVAYSNDCFELWFVLHSQYQTSAATRYEYYHLLSERLNCDYEKDGKAQAFAQGLYERFLKDQPKAILHASRLYEEKKNETFSSQNPCTTVFQLVEELNKCIRQ
jgi:hypothetical protein